MHSRVFLFLGVQEFVTFGILEAQESQYSQTQVKRDPLSQAACHPAYP